MVIVLFTFLLLQPRSPSQPAGLRFANNPLPVPSTAGAQAGGSTDSDSAALPAAPRVGRYSPDFTLSTLDGASVTLSELRGKPVWINFWATWCPPCRAEMPEMNRKYAAYKNSGLVLIGVDLGEDPQVVKEFVTQNGFDWTFALDRRSEVSQKYLVSGIPAHFFVGRDGIIKAVQIGGITPVVMERNLALIVGQ